MRNANTWPWRHSDGSIDLSRTGPSFVGLESRTAGMGWVLHTVNVVVGGVGGGGATATAFLWIELAARRLVRTRPRTHASSPVTFCSEEATAMQYRSQLGTSLDRPARATHSRTRVAETVGGTTPVGGSRTGRPRRAPPPAPAQSLAHPSSSWGPNREQPS
jgi:hypothetical protein